MGTKISNPAELSALDPEVTLDLINGTAGGVYPSFVEDLEERIHRLVQKRKTRLHQFFTPGSVH